MTPQVFHCALTAAFVELWKDRPEAKYPVGSIVRIIAPKFLSEPYLCNLVGSDFEVVACNGDSGEYILDGFPVLLWEDEIILSLGRERVYAFSPSQN